MKYLRTSGIALIFMAFGTLSLVYLLPYTYNLYQNIGEGSTNSIFNSNFDILKFLPSNEYYKDEIVFNQENGSTTQGFAFFEVFIKLKSKKNKINSMRVGDNIMKWFNTESDVPIQWTKKSGIIQGSFSKNNRDGNIKIVLNSSGKGLDVKIRARQGAAEGGVAENVAQDNSHSNEQEEGK